MRVYSAFDFNNPSIGEELEAGIQLSIEIYGVISIHLGLAKLILNQWSNVFSFRRKSIIRKCLLSCHRLSKHLKDLTTKKDKQTNNNDFNSKRKAFLLFHYKWSL